jgi:hypothetical protein
MSYRYRNEKSLMGRLLVIGFILLVMFLALAWLSGRPEENQTWMSLHAGDNPVITAQIAGSPPPPGPASASAGQLGRFPVIWQRDKNQYASEAEWRTWAASSCSAASLTSVLSGYGNNVRVSDVLALMQQQNAISSSGGLFDYSVFTTIPAKYGLKAIYSEDKNLDSHFERVLGYLRQGYPVVLNVRDPSFFPNGHFVLATAINQDGTIAIMNPDPAPGKTVNQNWPLDGTKLYFGRSLRSAAILPKA